MLIPLVDLTAQHRQIAHELQQRFARRFEKTAFILCEEIARFEREFARFSGVKHCVGIGNGTDGLEMMLRAAGVGNGDEVIVPTNSFIATAAGVVRADAIPTFADSGGGAADQPPHQRNCAGARLRPNRAHGGTEGPM